MQDIHPPVIAVWDPEVSGYVQASADVCVARWSTDRAGLLCGQEVFRRVGDAGFCAHHYERVLDSYGSILRQEDEGYGWSFDARRWDPDSAEIVYYIQRESDGLIKIGMSASFNRRISLLKWEHGPLRLLMTHRGDRDSERGMHAKFQHLRIEGEWFQPGKALTGWILEVRRRQERMIPSALLPGTVALSEVVALAEGGRSKRSKAIRT